MNLPTHRLTWLPCWRIIPSRFPPIDLFERVADPEDLDAIFELESLTNDRLREEVGEIRLIPAADRITGRGAGCIMAAFTHRNPTGSRFSNGTYGVYYAANTLDTAIAETRYHREQFMRATSEPPMALDMRVLVADLDQTLHDLRGLQGTYADVYDSDDYGASQRLGHRIRAQNSWGIVYDSVRDQGGECVAIFRPPALSKCRQERHLCYVWNGERIRSIYRKISLRLLP